MHNRITDAQWKTISNILANPNIATTVKMSALKPYINRPRESDGQTWLAEACHMKNEAFVAQLIHNGADVNQKTGEGHTALFVAASAQDLAIVKRLVAAGATINILSGLGRTPLAEACIRSNLPIVKFLLNKNADTNMQGEDGCLPIYAATMSKSNEIIALLVKNGADVNSAMISSGDTALLHAADDGYLSTVSTLIKFGANPNLANKKGMRPLALLVSQLKDCWNDEAKLAVTSLLHAGASLTHYDKEGMNCLTIALANGNKPLFSYLLSYFPKASIDQTNSNNISLLHIAANIKDSFYLKSLLDSGANPLLKAQLGKTPLHIAAQSGMITAAKILVSYIKNKNFSIDVKDDQQLTPLHVAVGKGNLKLVELFCQNNIDVNSRSYDGATPLFIASQEGYHEIVELLLKQGADMTIARADGTECVYIANKYKHQETTRVLLQHYFKNKLKIECSNFAPIFDTSDYFPDSAHSICFFAPISEMREIAKKEANVSNDDQVFSSSLSSKLQTAYSYLTVNGFTKDEIKAMQIANNIPFDKEVAQEKVLENKQQSYSWFKGMLTTDMPAIKPIGSGYTKTPNCYLYIDYKSIEEQGCVDALRFEHLPLSFCAPKRESGIKYLGKIASVQANIAGQINEFIITDELKFAKETYRVYAVRQLADNDQQATLIVALLYDKKGLHDDKSAIKLQLKTKILTIHLPEENSASTKNSFSK